MLTISVVMDFCAERPSHRATLAALAHAAEAADPVFAGLLRAAAGSARALA